MRTALFTPLLIFTFIACSTPKKPKITPISVTPTSVKPEAIGLSVAFDVKNPNDFTLTVRSVEGKLLIGKSAAHVGTVKVTTKIKIPAKSTKRVKADVTIPWQNLGALAPLVLSEGPIPYTFAGNADVGGKDWAVTVPFKLNGELTKAQIAQVGFKSLKNIPGLPQIPGLP